MNNERREQLDRMLHPRGLAVFGAVTSVGSFAHSTVLSLVRYGYPGRLYPISRRGGEVAGLRVYTSLEEVDGPVDLAAVAVPAQFVPQVLRDCLRHGVAGAQIHTSGFAETGESEGLALQEEIASIAGDGLRVMGPNCFGAYCPRGGITLLPGFDFPKESGPVAMIAQSGGVAADFSRAAHAAGLGPSKVISFGNGCDLDAVELLDYLSDDPETGFIAAYLEGVSDGRKFLQIVKETTPKKPVIIWKGGLTPLGNRATLSHTASMGGEAQVWSGALAQAGAIQVEGLREMIDTLAALHFLPTRGRRIALLGGGGAIGVFSSDLAYQLDLEVPTFSDETQARLRERFPTPGNSVPNPLDTGTPVLPLETVQALVEDVLTREPVDVLVMIMLMHSIELITPAHRKMVGVDLPPPGSYLTSLLPTLSRIKTETGKDVVVVFENRAQQPEHVDVEAVARNVRRAFQTAGIPVFTSTERALRGIRNASRAPTPLPGTLSAPPRPQPGLPRGRSG
jgi:acyl-CoA synthetase (NDP forming)